MLLPNLSLGLVRSVQIRSSGMPEERSGIQPAVAWQGQGHVTCGDGVTTPISDSCGSTPGDGRGLACFKKQKRFAAIGEESVIAMASLYRLSPAEGEQAEPWWRAKLFTSPEKACPQMEGDARETARSSSRVP